MLRKSLFLAIAAFLVTLIMSAKAQAWYAYHYGGSRGGYHYGYHYGGGGGYHYGYHYGGGAHYGYYRR